MGARKIALIGHSGTGKSAALLELGLDLQKADMDAVLGVGRSPPMEQALNWLTEGSAGQDIVVVSNHEEMLRAMCQAKKAGQYEDRFAQICFTYLHKPRVRLARHLAKPTAGDRTRDLASQQYILANYDRFHNMFVEMADCTIDCSTKQSPEVAGELNTILHSLKQPCV